MPEVIEGVVAAVAQREKGFSVRIGENWYSGFGRCPVNKGDTVKVEYNLVPSKEPGRPAFRNIVQPRGEKPKIEVVSAIPPAPPKAEKPETPEKIPSDVWERKDLRIARESVISSLCTLYAGSNKDIEDIIRLAKRLEKYIYEGN